jgi:hypothetical protein
VPKEGRCRLRVGDEVCVLQEGKCLVFDDSYEHESWNDDPEASRICLIMDIWHPDLTKKEVKFMNFLQNAALKAEKNMIAQRDAERKQQAEEAMEANQSEKGDCNSSDETIIDNSKNKDMVGDSVMRKEFDNFFTVIDAAQSICADDSGVFKEALK